MLFNHKITVYVIIFLCHQFLFSQDKLIPKDSSTILSGIVTPPKNKTAKFFHRLVFKPAKSQKIKKKIIVPKHLKVEGKIIRNIIITTLDPFGYSDSDIDKIPKNWSERTGNRAHLKSKKIAIRNLLLFSKNKRYSLLEIKESERILRAQNFINRVTITEKLAAPKSDSVDVFVRVLDSWSSIPKFNISNSIFQIQYFKFNISNSKTGLGLKERNFFGLGHQLDYYYSNRKSDGKEANNISYLIPNIKNSFIRTEVKYSVDFDRYYSKGITIERPFYSPLTKWAAGIALNQNYLKDSIQDVEENYISQNFKYNNHIFWAGRAFRIIKADTITERTTNLIIAACFSNLNYLIEPSETLDPTDFYDSEKLLLTGIGINTRQFIEDRYIFKNGQTEDVPVGRIYGITGGYRYKNSKWSPYLGAQISFGNYHSWGFLSTNFEVGSFFKQAKKEQSAISFQANYFTNIIEIENWKFRQFIKPQIIIGINREKA